MAHWEILTVDQGAEWDSALRDSGRHDVYHLAAYHRVAQEVKEGEPYLFVFKDGQGVAAMPFVRRSLVRVEGIRGGGGLCDATSVYGYPGIVSSVEQNTGGAKEFAISFQAALRAALHELRIFALFSRSNPLIENLWLLEGLADVRSAGMTIAIDLMQDDSEYYRQMSHGTRYHLKKAVKAGVAVVEDQDMRKLSDFIELYNQTMKRVGARQEYFFPNIYYKSIKKNLNEKCKIFYGLYDSKIIGAVMVFVQYPIIQYHLSGTRDGFLELSPTVAILESVRKWGKDAGFMWFHLGGGTGGTKDSLFRFKSNFSKRSFDFRVATAVLQQAEYVRVCEERRAWVERCGERLAVGSFFPAYRAPVIEEAERAGRVQSKGS